MAGMCRDRNEAKELGENFEKIIRENIPYLSKALDNEKEKEYYSDKFCFLDNKVLQEDKLLDKANLINYQENADDSTARAYQFQEWQKYCPAANQSTRSQLPFLHLDDADI